MSFSFPLIIADESVDFRIIQHLRGHDFQVYSITEELSGITDSEVIDVAIDKKAFILTEDKDFGDQLVYRKVSAVGSLLLRLRDVPITSRMRLTLETLKHHAPDLLQSFSVLTSKKLRMRRYDS